MKNKEKVKFDFDNINPVKFRLLDKQVDIILRALELYVYNLDYMLDCEKSDDEERQKKIAMVEYTYEEILSIQAEQVNTRIKDNSEEQNVIGRKILQNDNILRIIPDEKEIQAI